MIPIRCLSCGNPVSAYSDEYRIRMIGGKQLFDELQDRDLVKDFMQQLIIEKKEPKEIFGNLGLRGNYSSDKSKDVLDDLGLTRYCCRRMLISHVETWE